MRFTHSRSDAGLLAVAAACCALQPQMSRRAAQPSGELIPDRGNLGASSRSARNGRCRPASIGQRDALQARERPRGQLKAQLPPYYKRRGAYDLSATTPWATTAPKVPMATCCLEETVRRKAQAML